MNLLDALEQWIREVPALTSITLLEWLVLAMGVLLVMLWASGIARIRRATRLLRRVLDESTPDRLLFDPRDRSGFRAEIVTPSEPYQQLQVDYRAPSFFNPLAIVAAVFGRSRGQLTLQASLRQPPTAELIWVRGSVPGQAFQKETNPSSWVHRKIAVTNSEYATRGSYVEPLVRTFVEFQTRFSPALRRVCIQREHAHKEVEVVVAMNPLSPHSLPHLIAYVWSLGQAATRN